MYDLMSMSVKMYRLNYLAFNTGFFEITDILKLKTTGEKWLNSSFPLCTWILNSALHLEQRKTTAGILTKGGSENSVIFQSLGKSNSFTSMYSIPGL